MLMTERLKTSEKLQDDKLRTNRTPTTPRIRGSEFYSYYQPADWYENRYRSNSLGPFTQSKNNLQKYPSMANQLKNLEGIYDIDGQTNGRIINKQASESQMDSWSFRIKDNESNSKKYIKQ